MLIYTDRVDTGRFSEDDVDADDDDDADNDWL